MSLRPSANLVCEILEETDFCKAARTLINDQATIGEQALSIGEEMGKNLAETAGLLFF